MGELAQAYLEKNWPSGRPFQMIALGQNAVDLICSIPHYPDHNTKVRMKRWMRLGGGQIATAAAQCARYGLKVRYVGRVGDDDNGRFSLQDLRREPMELCVETVPGAFSQFSIILVDRPTGERTIVWDRDPRLSYAEEGLRRDWIVEGQLLHLDGDDPASRIQAARWAREARMKVSLDIDSVSPRAEELLRLVDFALPSQDFVKAFTGCRDWREGLLALAEIVPGLVGMTRGGDGSALVWKGRVVKVPGYPVQPVDTTGAGDAFHGGFIYGLFQDWSLERCLAFANAAGALCCTRFGARQGIPALEEVLEWASERG